MRWLFAVLICTLCLGCSTTNPIVTREPPMPKEERRTLNPGNDTFWKAGHWAWDPKIEHYYWVVGQWENERPDRFWVPGYWTPVEEEGVKGWRWVDERWARKEELDRPQTE